jgi:hypothetical protein
LVRRGGKRVVFSEVTNRKVTDEFPAPLFGKERGEKNVINVFRILKRSNICRLGRGTKPNTKNPWFCWVSQGFNPTYI